MPLRSRPTHRLVCVRQVEGDEHGEHAPASQIGGGVDALEPHVLRARARCRKAPVRCDSDTAAEVGRRICNSAPTSSGRSQAITIRSTIRGRQAGATGSATHLPVAAQAGHPAGGGRELQEERGHHALVLRQPVVQRLLGDEEQLRARALQSGAGARAPTRSADMARSAGGQRLQGVQWVGGVAGCSRGQQMQRRDQHESCCRCPPHAPSRAPPRRPSRAAPRVPGSGPGSRGRSGPAARCPPEPARVSA